MSESKPHSDAFGAIPSAADQPDPTDLRLVDVLRGSSSGAELRKELQHEDTTEASDLLARLNALDFVQRVVGETVDVPDRIGGYEVRGMLGRGGMGTVYLGWQSDLEREVALKVLAPSFTSDPTMRKRFRAEARATAALHHRHIVPIYDYGEAQGMLFFAMERVDGMSLDKHIAAARRVGAPALQPLDAARRFAGVADALGLAHRRRLLHRDVKPGNILVAADGTLALTDFGLAKALDHASMHLTSKGGGFLGTLHYASPEQALGAELSPASDLYSLGVTIFEAVTGELPITGRTTEALLQSILHGTPRRLRTFLPKPPRDLEAVLDRLLSREPSDRYQDGEELARDLLRIADGEPVHIRRQPLMRRLWRRVRKNPVLTGALLAVFVLVLATLTLAAVLTREKGQTLPLRHQNKLIAIAKGIGQEAGPVAGPPPFLFALTGVEVEPEQPNDPILQELRAAELELPGDSRAAEMRAAYSDGLNQEARALLREGRGYEAFALYDSAIATQLSKRTGGDLAVELSLYGLHLGRGVARLTAAVAQPNEARTDLALASFLRPGAVFPEALLDMLDVVQSPDVGAAADRLERKLAADASERVRTVALLLWTAAGECPPRAANLMDFGLAFAPRRHLHQLAARLLGGPPCECMRRGQPTGLAAVFEGACREALEKLGDPAALRDLAEQTSKSIESASRPESPLQGWRYVLQLLLQPSLKGPLLDKDQLPLAPALQLAAWEDLLRLEPRRDLVRLWLSRFDDLRRSHPGLPGMLPVAARLHLLAETGEARTIIDSWIVEAGGDPAAQLCRMQMALREGRLEEARDDAMVAVQQSIAPEETLRDIVACCVDTAGRLGPAEVEAVRLMGLEFRALLPGSGAGGTR